MNQLPFVMGRAELSSRDGIEVLLHGLFAKGESAPDRLPHHPSQSYI